MAERRMFAKTIIDSDAFLDMPLSAQALYYHLSMRADDDGFVNNPKKIQRLIGASEDDLKLLIAKSFLIKFESGVVVIKHWRMHNYIQSDRYKKTVYQDELELLKLKDNKAYTLNIDKLDTECIQDVSKTDTQVRLGKYRLNNIDTNVSMSSADDIQAVMDLWNTLEGRGDIKAIKSISPGSKRRDSVNARLKSHGLDGFKEAIENIRSSDFLQGNNKKGWTIAFDWFIKPNNFIKVLEGNYNGKGKRDARSPNKFDNFTGRQYDAAELEKKLLGG